MFKFTLKELFLAGCKVGLSLSFLLVKLFLVGCEISIRRFCLSFLLAKLFLAKLFPGGLQDEPPPLLSAVCSPARSGKAVLHKPQGLPPSV